MKKVKILVIATVVSIFLLGACGTNQEKNVTERGPFTPSDLPIN